MMGIEQFNPNNLKMLDTKMQKVLDDVAKECGIVIKVTGCTYNHQNAAFKIKVATIVNGEVQTKEAQDFKHQAKLYGFKPEDLGREFIDRKGRKCIITGLLTRRWKYPIQYQVVKTKQMIVSTSHAVLRQLGEPEIATHL